MKKYSIWIFVTILIYIVSILLFIRLTTDFYGEVITSTKADQLGSFIGGVFGCLFSAITLIVLLISIKDATNDKIKNEQENRFFLLLNMMMDYFRDLYIESNESNKTLKNKKVFLIINREFSFIYGCLLEIMKEYKYCSITKINIVFGVLYYGVGPKSTYQLRCYLERLELSISEINSIINKSKEIHKLECNDKFKYYKPMGGHQSRLEPYINLLLCIFEFIKETQDESNYIRILRTQLSMYECFLLFIIANTIKDDLKVYLNQYLTNIDTYALYFESFHIEYNEYIKHQ